MKKHWVMDYETLCNCFTAVFEHYKTQETKVFVIHDLRNDLDKFIEFGIEKHAPIYKGTAINDAVYRVFRKAASKRGYEFDVTPLVDFIGRKK